MQKLKIFRQYPRIQPDGLTNWSRTRRLAGQLSTVLHKLDKSERDDLIDQISESKTCKSFIGRSSIRNRQAKPQIKTCDQRMCYGCASSVREERLFDLRHWLGTNCDVEVVYAEFIYVLPAATASAELIKGWLDRIKDRFTRNLGPSVWYLADSDSGGGYRRFAWRWIVINRKSGNPRKVFRKLDRDIDVQHELVGPRPVTEAHAAGFFDTQMVSNNALNTARWLAVEKFTRFAPPRPFGPVDAPDDGQPQRHDDGRPVSQDVDHWLAVALAGPDDPHFDVLDSAVWLWRSGRNPKREGCWDELADHHETWIHAGRRARSMGFGLDWNYARYAVATVFDRNHTEAFMHDPLALELLDALHLHRDPSPLGMKSVAATAERLDADELAAG